MLVKNGELWEFDHPFNLQPPPPHHHERSRDSPSRQRRRDRRKAARAQATVEEIVVIDDSEEAQVSVNTDDETTDAENIVSYKLKEVEQILIVDASSTTETEEAKQVTEEVGCDDLTEEVIDYETNIYEEVIDVAEEVTEKTRVVIVDEVNDDNKETTENEIENNEPENSCDICNFVGKTPAGLKTHKRARHKPLFPRRYSR